MTALPYTRDSLIRFHRDNMTRLVDNTDYTESDVVIANSGDLHVRDRSTHLR